MAQVADRRDLESRDESGLDERRLARAARPHHRHQPWRPAQLHEDVDVGLAAEEQVGVVGGVRAEPEVGLAPGVDRDRQPCRAGAPDGVGDAVDDVVVGGALHLHVRARGEVGPQTALLLRAGEEQGDDREIHLQDGPIEGQVDLEGLHARDPLRPDRDQDRLGVLDALGDALSPPLARTDVDPVEPHVDLPALQPLRDRRDDVSVAVAVGDEDVGHVRLRQRDRDAHAVPPHRSVELGGGDVDRARQGRVVESVTLIV